MAIQTPGQWLASQNNTSNTPSTKSTNIQSPSEWLATQPAPKKTLGSRVKSAAEWLTAPIVKPFAEVATNAVNAVQLATGNEETQPFSGSYLGEVNGLGKLDPTKGFTPETVKTIKKSVGIGAEIASTIGGGGVAKDALGNVIKPTLTKLAFEGAGLNATYGLGQSLSENQGLKDTAKNVATQGAIGAVAGPVLGLVGKGISKLLGKEKVAVISKEADTIFTKPKDVNITTVEKPTTVPFDTSKLVDTTGKHDIRTIMTTLQEGGYSKKEVINIMQNVAAKNPTETRYSFKDVADIRYSLYPDKEIKYSKLTTPIPDTGIPSKSTLTAQGSISTDIPKVTENAPGTIKTTETANIPLEQQTPEFKAKVDEISNNIRQETTTDFEHQTNRQQIATVLSKDPQYVLDVATGKMAPEGGVPDTAYLAVAQNMADKLAAEGDFSLVDKLSQSNIGRKAGQTLQALQIAMKNSVTGIVRDIRTSLEDKLPNTIRKNADKELQSIKESISKVLESTDIRKMGKEDILLAVEKLRC